MAIHCHIAALIAALTIVPMPTWGATGGIAVIVHIENPVEAMSANAVRQHSLKNNKKTWSSGPKIRPVGRLGLPAGRKAFLNGALDMTAEEEERYWIEKQYTRAENPPKRLADDEQIIHFVANFIGGIGYVKLESLDGETKKKVKSVLEITLDGIIVEP